MTLLFGRLERHPACKKTEWWGAGVDICLEQGADLHMAQLIPLSLTVPWFSKIQIGFTFLVPAHLGSPGKRAVKRVCVCVLFKGCVRNGPGRGPPSMARVSPLPNPKNQTSPMRTVLPLLVLSACRSCHHHFHALAVVVIVMTRSRRLLTQKIAVTLLRSHRNTQQ